jgi:hypothetical protein
MRLSPLRLAHLLAVVTTAVVVSPPRAAGELLYFKAGGRIQAPATVRDGLVTVETPFGRFEFPESDFLKIVPGYCPERDWPARRDAALAGDVEARLSAAWWALENGLVPECVGMLREARASAPSDPQAARLGTLIDRLDRPCPDPDTATLRTALGTPCEEARSQHVLLLHQTDPAEARARLEVLENVVTAFYICFAFQGFDLPVPKNRLVSVYLRDRDRYVAFLESQNAGSFRSTFGYFHPTLQAVVAYDLRPTQLRNRPDGTHATDRRLKLLREAELRAFDLGTAAHEMVHLVVSVSGFDRDRRRMPLWVHEGLAAQFEVVRGGRWAGVGRAHDIRLPDWHALPTPPPLVTLLRDSAFGRGYQRDLYAGCWALVAYLQKTHPREFLTFIDLLRNPETSEDSRGDRVLDLFRQAFGDDLSSLEADWHRQTSATRTPLDDYAPKSR